MYRSPVELMDAIAQMTILLGIMCPCNFIINVVTLIVKMAMATRNPRMQTSIMAIKMSFSKSSQQVYMQLSINLMLMARQRHTLSVLHVTTPTSPAMIGLLP
jgi:hypothetical protein